MRRQYIKWWNVFQSLKQDLFFMRECMQSIYISLYLGNMQLQHIRHFKSFGELYCGIEDAITDLHKEIDHWKEQCEKLELENEDLTLANDSLEEALVIMKKKKKSR